MPASSAAWTVAMLSASSAGAVAAGHAHAAEAERGNVGTIAAERPRGKR